MAEKTKPPVQAAKTTLQVIDALSELNGAKVKELAAHLELPVSTVHNYLKTLEDNEYIIKEDGKYKTSLRFLYYGECARDRRTIYEVAKPELKELATKTGELVSLMVEEHGRGVYIYRTKGSRAAPVRTYVGGHVGERVYLHSSASGKAILARLDRTQTEEILDHHGLPAITQYTITEKDDLLGELETIAADNIAFADEEGLRGLRSVAAPIVRNGVVHGAISVSGPTSRLTNERFNEELPRAVSETANVIEINMAFS